MTQKRNPFATMPLCGAKKRSGKPCQRIGSKRNGRCKLHGGRAGAPSGTRNGRWKHGQATKEAKAERQALKAMLRRAKEHIDALA